MSLKMKLNIVNKYEYEKNEDYKEIIIQIPKKEEELKKDFEYLGLDSKNLYVKQDIYVLNCEVIDTENPYFSSELTTEISKTIDKAKGTYYTTLYEDISSMFYKLGCLDSKSKEDLLAVLEKKRGKIHGIRDIDECIMLLDFFELYDDVHNSKEYALKLIEYSKIELKDIIDYINLEKIGEKYIKERNGIFTNQGLLFENCDVDDHFSITYSERKKASIRKEEEEEFE